MFPSPGGDVLRRWRQNMGHTHEAFPSPGGDVLRRLAAVSSSSILCFRPLAGMCCVARPARSCRRPCRRRFRPLAGMCCVDDNDFYADNRVDGFRPLAGMCCVCSPASGIWTTWRFPSPGGDVLRRQICTKQSFKKESFRAFRFPFVTYYSKSVFLLQETSVFSGHIPVRRPQNACLNMSCFCWLRT